MYCTIWLYGWVVIAYLLVLVLRKQWEVAIMTLIITFVSIKFAFVEIDNWLNLNKCPCWNSTHDPFTTKANTWTWTIISIDLLGQ